MRIPSTGSRAGTLMLATALLMAGPAMAQSEAGAELTTANGLVAAVLAANPGLQAMQAAADTARARADAAGALDDPMLSYLSAPETIGSDVGTRHIVQLSQAIPWPGKRGDRAAAAGYRHDARRFEQQDYRLQLERSARSLFAEWRYANAAVAINRRQQALLDEMIEVAQSRYASGRGRQQDVLKAKLQRQHLRHQAFALEQQVGTLRAQINALLARPASAPLPPPAEPAADSPTLPTPADTHPMLDALAAEERAGERGVALARAAGRPDFRLLANYVGTLDPAEKRLQVGAAINIPIRFDRRRADEDAARAQLQRTRYRRADRELRIEAEREAARWHFRHAEHSRHLLEAEILPLARAGFRAALADYRAGRGSFADLIDAEGQQLKAELDLHRARADRARAAADWQRWAGH